MATLVPISFNMGQAGEIIQASKVSGMDNSPKVADRWYVNPATRQAKVLESAMQIAASLGTSMNEAIIYPGMEEVSSLIYNGIYQDGNTHSSFLAQTMTRTEGWYLGLKAEYTDSAATQTKSDLVANVGDQNVGTYTYTTDGTDQYAVAQPLYFQQNTWLKTALEPFDEGWHARMGFIYDTDYYKNLGSGGGNEGIFSNNNEEGYNDSSNTNPTFQGGNFVWNLFPVPTNTLEGHATVYCYFDRSNFNKGDWVNKVDQIDQLDDYRDIESKTTPKNQDYINRLNDPSLRYSDPW